MPSAMNWVAKTDFPVPEAPATRTLSPSGMPPPSILSNSGIPMERRRVLGIFLTCPASPRVREKACSPAGVMRKVCSPGTDACPRFHDLEFPHNGTSLRSLVKPKEAIGDRENGIITDFTLDIFPDQKSRGLPTRQEQG